MKTDIEFVRLFRDDFFNRLKDNKDYKKKDIIRLYHITMGAIVVNENVEITSTKEREDI